MSRAGSGRQQPRLKARKHLARWSCTGSLRHFKTSFRRLVTHFSRRRRHRTPALLALHTSASSRYGNYTRWVTWVVPCAAATTHFDGIRKSPTNQKHDNRGESELYMCTKPCLFLLLLQINKFLREHLSRDFLGDPLC